MTPEANEQELPSPDELEPHADLCETVLTELKRVIYGKPDLLKQVLVCLLSRGHVLLEGLPGLGKTQLVRSLSQVLDLQFDRIQFTPDLLPTDITGSNIVSETGDGKSFTFHKGPVFSNIVLADEINRASPKTQSALLEAMEERTVTVLGEQYTLPAPFFVLATQNPIEMEGTYPLPEAQLDRFHFRLVVEGVSDETLEKILLDRPKGDPPELKPACSSEEVKKLLKMVPRIHLSRPAARYISRIVSATHPGYSDELPEVEQYVEHGASPRAGLAISQAARAHALMNRRPSVGFEDIQAVAVPAMNHRIILDYSANLDDVTTADLIEMILERTETLSEDLPDTISTGAQA